MTKVKVAVPWGGTVTLWREAPVAPVPRVAGALGSGRGSEPSDGAAPHTANQGFFVSGAVKTRLAELHATLSGASLMPSFSEYHTGRRSVRTVNWNFRSRLCAAVFLKVYW